jgi:hypothetical protein
MTYNYHTLLLLLCNLSANIQTLQFVEQIYCEFNEI